MFVLPVFRVGWPLLLILGTVLGVDTDQFHYGDEYIDTPNHIFPPQSWDQVQCSELSSCMGWPDGFEEGIGWELGDNFCQWCPADNSVNCGQHHESPIDLKRNRALSDNADYNECIDVHWMAYYDSSCTFDQLVDFDAFSIERHALKIHQPTQRIAGTEDSWRLACQLNGSRRFGRIDFSRGFSQWWFLSHIDFHVPSEHHQEGHQYAGELQMYHFYSVSSEEAGVHNQMGTVSIFLDAYPQQEDWDVLNKIICQWRVVEQSTLDECSLDHDIPLYEACDEIPANYTAGRNLRKSDDNTKSVHDIILHNHLHGHSTGEYQYLVMDDENFEPADPNFDWDEFIDSVYLDEQEKKAAKEQNRDLKTDYDAVPWFNYFAMLEVKTEYYYRYSGTQTIPPCYGKFYEGNDRDQTNNWRVLKDPIRVSQRQIDEMHRLLKSRIAPMTDPIRPCQPDTAAKPDPVVPDKVSVARPLQYTHKAHQKVFCQCDDWTSKWEEDKAWCQMDKLDRFYDHPYNFASDGFAPLQTSELTRE